MPRQYTRKVMDHFACPHNVGEIPNADGMGKVGNPVDGDLVYIYIKVKDDKLEDIKFKAFGCAAAIATSSMVTDLAKGKSLEEAIKITKEDVANELGGLPPQKMLCSNLGADALHAAIHDYLIKQGREAPGHKQPKPEDEHLFVEEGSPIRMDSA